MRYGLVLWIGDVACAVRVSSDGPGDGFTAPVPAGAGAWWRDPSGPVRLTELVEQLAASYPGDELVALTLLAPAEARRGLDGALAFAVPDVEVQVVPVQEALSDTLGAQVRVAEWRDGVVCWSGTEGRPVALAPEQAWAAGRHSRAAEETAGIEQQVVERFLEAYARSVELPADEEPVPVDDDVRFTVYRPRAARPGRREQLLAFAHKTDEYEEDGQVVDPVEEVARQAQEVLGDLSRHLTSAQDSELPLTRGDTLRFVPVVDGIEFNPAALEFRWLRGVHREVFEFTPGAHLDGQTLTGRLSVYLGLRLVADVTLRIRVDRAAPDGPQDPSRGRVYGKVFPSYSHQDAMVVDQIATAAGALGHQYLRDVERLRAGQDWQTELERYIDDADIFQLFWSPASMTSPHVQHEWTYALSLGRPDFVRPVYWQQPRPSAPPHLPPPELDRLHFAYLGATAPPAPPPAPAPAPAPAPPPARRASRAPTRRAETPSRRGVRGTLAAVGVAAVTGIAVTVGVTAGGGGAPVANPPPASSPPATVSEQPAPTSAPFVPDADTAAVTVTAFFAALDGPDLSAALAFVCADQDEDFRREVARLARLRWSVPAVVSNDVRSEGRYVVVDLTAREGQDSAPLRIGVLIVLEAARPLVCGLEET